MKFASNSFPFRCLSIPCFVVKKLSGLNGKRDLGRIQYRNHAEQTFPPRIASRHEPRWAARFVAPDGWFVPSTTMAKEHEEPILTKLLYVFGLVTIVGAIIGAVICTAQQSTGVGIAVGIGGVFAGIVYIGIGQAVDYLARTAQSAERLRTIMETSLLRQLKSFEILLSAAKPSGQKKDIPPPPAQATTRLPAVFHFALDGANQGPFTSIDMRDFRAAGVVSDDTPVFREGEAEWRTYSGFQELTT